MCSGTYAVKFVLGEDNMELANESKILDKFLGVPSIVQKHEFLPKTIIFDNKGTEKKGTALITNRVKYADIVGFVRHENFTEKMARTYFRSLIESTPKPHSLTFLALELLHVSSVVHRDIKLENLLFDENFNLVIIDFGFSTKLKDHDQKVFEKLGTIKYMAPETFENAEKGYLGQPVDIYACGLVLFYMLAKMMPWAACTDELYEEFRRNNAQFWKYSRIKDDLAIKLLNAMLDVDPKARPTIEQIKNSPWYQQDEVMKFEEIKEIFDPNPLPPLTPIKTSECSVVNFFCFDDNFNRIKKNMSIWISKECLLNGKKKVDETQCWICSLRFQLRTCSTF